MGKSGNMMNVVKGVAGGMLAGMAVGYAGKKILDGKPKMKKNAKNLQKSWKKKKMKLFYLKTKM